MRNHYCRAKARSITYSECVFVALIIQHAKRIRRFILSSLAHQAEPHYLINYKIFGGKFIYIYN